MVSLFVLYIVKNTIKKCPIGDNNLECSGHGKCQDNSCVCDHKYFGDKCDTVVECTSPNDCKAGKVCIKNKCQYQCNENKDCDINKEKCVNNRCQSVICKTDQDCGTNQKCNNIGVCECMIAFKNCPKGCVDIKTDPNNCGDCDKVIPKNSTCQDGNFVCDKYYTGTNCENKLECIDDTECGANGKCISGKCGCQDSFNKCSDGCKNINDPNNCGSCGNKIPVNSTCFAYKQADKIISNYVCNPGFFGTDCKYPISMCKGVIIPGQPGDIPCICQNNAPTYDPPFCETPGINCQQFCMNNFPASEFQNCMANCH